MVVAELVSMTTTIVQKPRHSFTGMLMNEQCRIQGHADNSIHGVKGHWGLTMWFLRQPEFELMNSGKVWVHMPIMHPAPCTGGGV